ncbi:hypothetical protein [Jiulongibacter sediminis]|uniref:Uncharacterized protein n=1 Tax=Jiulongibacter sediminis TaxID=1605367 RepID=A0A0P7C4I6_9BACT|nr:hypothetical protein [Jiulongibacter sediminis]KPM48153.1 hypothetical protein AFM12_12285 [Jiulongibacter sediminis]TBX24322.1 hypothetical protein TK44_12295 [Jiulongibacter sediminis]
MKYLLGFLALTIFQCGAQIPNVEQQIADAVLALDAADREEATVFGYNSDGDLITIKKGTNAQVCLADDPGKEGFSVACYHKDLEPFMARGRELRAEGKDRGEVEQIREEEAKNGKLKMPEGSSTLAVLSGPSKEEANIRYVVYIPWATAESTGLPTKPMVAGGPWIMFPGSYRAHIMISPPNN